MGHLGVTEVVLVLGLLGLIFAERIIRWFTRRIARTPASSIPTDDAAPARDVPAEARPVEEPDADERPVPETGS